MVPASGAFRLPGDSMIVGPFGEILEEATQPVEVTLRAELDSAKSLGWLVPAVAWGYFPVNADGNDLIVWTDDDRRIERLRAFCRRASRKATTAVNRPTSKDTRVP